MIFQKSFTFLFLCAILQSNAKKPDICYCEDGVVSPEDSTQCICSVPVGDCGPNIAHVPDGDADTKAEATGDCGNLASASGAGSEAIIMGGQLNKAVARSDGSLVLIEGGTLNSATSKADGARAEVLNGEGSCGSENKVLAKSPGCLAQVENGDRNTVTCDPPESVAYVHDANDCNIMTFKEALSCSIEEDGIVAKDRDCEIVD